MRGGFNIRSRGRNIFLLAVSLFIAFLLGEVFVRVTGVGDGPCYMMVNNKICVRRFYSSYTNRKENVALVKINNLGFHDYNREVRNDRYRVLFLGDSFVEGAQVGLDDLFTSLLQERFQQEDRPVEAINGGTEGVGTAYEYLLWKEFFKKRIKIDHIVLCFILGNDLENNNLFLNRAILGNGPRDSTVHLDSAGRIFTNYPKRSRRQLFMRYICSRSMLLNTIRERLYLLKLQFKRRQGETTGRDGNREEKLRQSISYAWSQTITATLGLIERWNNELLQENIMFSIVVIGKAPYHTGHDPQYKASFLTKLRKLCLQDNIQMLELNLEEHDPYEIFSFDGTTLGHFNRSGHRLTANKIFLWLKKFI